MRKVLLALLVFPAISFSQINKEQNQEKSKLETFSEKSGSLIKKTFIDIGKIKDMKVQVLTLEDVTSNVNVSGLRLEMSSYSSIGSDTKIAFLDKDEVTGLIETLTYFKEKVFGTVPENYTEVTYSSRSGFSASVFRDGKDWSVVLRLEKYDSRSKVYFKEKEIPDLISLVEQAKGKL